MKYTYDETTLTIEADEAERAALREVATDLPDHYGTHGHEVEFMDGLICNSELDWIQPDECDDMTDAPILGIVGPTDIPENELYAHENAVGWRCCGCWKGETFYNAILQRWGYEPYQLRSFLTDLMETGRAVFRSSW